MPANYVAPTLSSVDSGDVVEFSPASLSWVSEDVVAAQASAWQTQFAAFYDITLEDWIASGNDALFASVDGLKFLGLVENGKITDAAINAAEAAEIAGSTAWYCCYDFNYGDFSDVKYWPTLSSSANFCECVFGDSVPTKGNATFYACTFNSVLPSGTLMDWTTFEPGATAQDGTIFTGMAPRFAIANPEVVVCSDCEGFTSLEQVASYASVTNSYLPNNIDLTYAQATTFGVLSGNNYLGSNSYILADEHCSDLFYDLYMYKNVTADMLDQTKTRADQWSEGGARLRSDQYSLIYPLIRSDVIAHMDDPEYTSYWNIYFEDGGGVYGTELYLY